MIRRAWRSWIGCVLWLNGRRSVVDEAERIRIEHSGVTTDDLAAALDRLRRGQPAW